MCSLDALDPNAYKAYKSVHDLDEVVDRLLAYRSGGLGSGASGGARTGTGAGTGAGDDDDGDDDDAYEGVEKTTAKLGPRSMSTGIRLMSPVQPMLVRRAPLFFEFSRIVDDMEYESEYE